MDGHTEIEFKKKYARSVFLRKATALLPSLIIPINFFSHFSKGKRKQNFNKPFNNIKHSNFIPSYLKLHETGELKKRGNELWNIMSRCWLCPRTCRKNRFEGNLGTCKASSSLEISSYNPHFGEEDPLVGRHGSGTIFFTHCSLRCVFCINWQISIGGIGSVRSIGKLTKMMLHLQEIGCHNINVVTPTHYSPHIVLALDQAAAKGLIIPLVYNTCGTSVLRFSNCLTELWIFIFPISNTPMDKWPINIPRKQKTTPRLPKKH